MDKDQITYSIVTGHYDSSVKPYYLAKFKMEGGKEAMCGISVPKEEEGIMSCPEWFRELVVNELTKKIYG